MVTMAQSLNSRGVEVLSRLKRTMARALDNNPLSLPARTDLTVTQSATSDGTLTNLPLAASNLLTANARDLVAWYGGYPAGASAASASVVVPVSSMLPGNGNLQGYTNTPSNVTADLSQWTAVMEFMTDATTVELGFLLSNKRVVFLLVNGQYLVDRTTGWTGAGAGNANSFLKIAGLTGINRITALFGVDVSGPSATMVAGLRTNALASVWKPDQQNVLRAAFAGDSFVEGQGLLANGNFVHTVPNAPMAQVAGQLLGIRDVRQFAVGGSGYLADNNGTRSKFAAQIARWAPNGNGPTGQGPFDLIVINHGFNDQAQAAAAPDTFQAEVLADLRLIRSYSAAPIVVLGSQAGKRGPDANTLLVEARIKAAVEQVADPLCRFAPVSADVQPWISGTGQIGATNGSGNSDLYTSAAPDTSHPSLAGHYYLGQRVATAVRAAVSAMLA